MATWTPQTKDTSNWTDRSKDTSVFSNQSKAIVIAESGQAMGPLGCTYSGGQSLTPTVPAWKNQTKD